MNLNHQAIAVLALAPMVAFASADIVYDEAVDGDMSDDPNAPTFVSFSGGSNTVIFTTDGEGDDRDIFTFNVAAGFELTGIVLDLFDTDTEFNLGFMGFSAGDVLDADPLNPNPSGLLGYALPSEADSGTDFFDLMGMAAGSQGYDGPLGAGDYTYWAQETSPSADDWIISFIITPVPGPGVLAMAAVAGLAGRRRRS